MLVHTSQAHLWIHASALSTRLVTAGAKQTELIALLHRMGTQHGLSAKPFSVGPTGLISVDIDVDDGSADTQSGIFTLLLAHPPAFCFV